MMVMRMVAIRADPAHVMVMSRLRHAGIPLVTDDLGAVFAKLAIHRRLRFPDLANPVAERIEHTRMVAQIERLDKFDLRKATGDCLNLLVDALDEDAGKQEIRKHDDAAQAEPSRAISSQTARQGGPERPRRAAKPVG